MDILQATPGVYIRHQDETEALLVVVDPSDSGDELSVKSIENIESNESNERVEKILYEDIGEYIPITKEDQPEYFL